MKIAPRSNKFSFYISNKNKSIKLMITLADSKPKPNFQFVIKLSEKTSINCLQIRK